MGADRLEESLADYNTALAMNPENMDARFYRGRVYERMGQLDHAIADFSAVLKMDPNHIKASYARGACQNLKGEFEAAISAPCPKSAAAHHRSVGKCTMLLEFYAFKHESWHDSKFQLDQPGHPTMSANVLMCRSEMLTVRVSGDGMRTSPAALYSVQSAAQALAIKPVA